MEEFTGERGKHVDDFIDNFESTAAVSGWNEVQKYIYMRKLLRGAAKLAIEASMNVNNYITLVDKLKEEFYELESSVDIHRKLTAMKKTEKETYLEYVFKMKKIGSRSNIDEKSIVSYIIQGIPDTNYNKMMLFEAKTIAELRRKLETYEQFKQFCQTGPSNSTNSKQYYKNNNYSGNSSLTNVSQQQFYNSQESNATKNQEKQVIKNNNNQTVKGRCVNCGAVNHRTQECPDIHKGKRCFKCNEYGHIARSCRSTSQQRYPENVSCISKEAPSMQIEVELYSQKIWSLVDTGSDVSLLRKSVYKSLISAPVLENKVLRLNGLGQHLLYTCGYLKAVVNINSLYFNLICHIVEDSAINHDKLIGKNFLNNVKVKITNGKVEITEEKRTYTIAENNIGEIDPSIYAVEENLEAANNIENKQISKCRKSIC